MGKPTKLQCNIPTSAMILRDKSVPSGLLFQLCPIQISAIPKNRKFNNRVVLTATTETSSSLPKGSPSDFNQ